MSTANRELVHRWFEEVWNKQREEAIDEMFAADGKSFGIPEPDSVLVGPQSFKTVHRTFLGAFPDVHISIRDTVCEGDRVAVTWTAKMTHLGDSLGFSPTFEKVSLEGCSVLIVRNGQLQDGRNYMEIVGLIHRLNNIAAPPIEATQTTARA